MGSRITGWGAALPEKVLTNHDLEGWLDTNDQWIVERTGISERRVGGVTSDLAVQAGQAALSRAGRSPGDVDALILATSTPDQTVPATAPTVQELLGLDCGAFDVNAACSGFVYGLVVAHGMVAVGHRCVLVVGADALSRITDWDDRGTAILFADGGGAVVLEADDEDHLLGWDLASDGSTRDLLYADHGSTIVMDGPEIFRKAVRVVVESGERALERAGVTADELALVVPHQANQRIIDSAARRLGVPDGKVVSIIARTGNTSAGSIPLALVQAADDGRLADGDLVLLVGFGAGMTAASAVVRWSAP
ncbi:MAG TPA: beta-ketoacyl-ACP synthase III [Acidimicrobiales bacterium]|nr:beta-ketoacyl-ACP synthase III [Acidimicrobiales bacterium]